MYEVACAMPALGGNPESFLPGTDREEGHVADDVAPMEVGEPLMEKGEYGGYGQNAALANGGVGDLD